MNILNREMNNYAIKAILPKVIIVAVVANLALPIFALLSSVIDTLQANIKIFSPTTFDWKYIIGPADADPGRILEKSGLIATIAIIGLIIAGGLGGLGCIIGGALLLGALIIIILLSLLLSFRPYVVLLAAAISPLAIGCYILPQTKSMFDKWMKIAAAWLVMPLGAFFIINLGYKIPTDLKIEGSGTVSAILGVFLPAALRAGLLILAIRFPFTIEGDITSGIAKLGQLAGRGALKGAASLGALEGQAKWPDAWIASKNKGLQAGGKAFKYIGKMANRPVTTAAETIGAWRGQKNLADNLRKNNWAYRQLERAVFPMVRLNTIPEIIQEKRAQNDKLIEDAVIEDAQDSSFYRDPIVAAKAKRDGLREKHIDNTIEENQEKLNKYLDADLNAGTGGPVLRRFEAIFDEMSNLTAKELMKAYKQAALDQQWQEAIAAQEALHPGRDRTIPADAKFLGEQAAAALAAPTPLAPTGTKNQLIADLKALEDAGDRDAIYADMQARAPRGSDLQKRVVDTFVDQLGSTKSGGALEGGGSRVGWGHSSSTDFIEHAMIARLLKEKSGRQYEPIGLGDIRGRNRAEIYAARNLNKYAGGFDDQDDGDMLSASGDIGAVLSRLPRDTNLSVDSVRRMAKTMKLEGAFNGGADDTVATAAIISQSLQKAMSPDRFASFAGAMARGDDVTVNNVLQGAKGEERDLLHASITAKEIATTHALDSGEAQNVAVYATRIAPQFASIRNNQQQITQLKQSAETIISHESNTAFNASRPTGATPRETLTPEALEPHKKAIAQMIGTSPDTIDGKSAQFFLRATDALQTATSTPKIQTQQQPPVATPEPPIAEKTSSGPESGPQPATPQPDIPKAPNDNKEQ